MDRALDDDDEFGRRPRRAMLNACHERVGMVLRIARMQLLTGDWRDVGEPPLRRDHGLPFGGVLLGGLRFMHHDVTPGSSASRATEPVAAMKQSGVRTGFVPS